MSIWDVIESGLDLAVAASCGSSSQGGSLHGYEGAVEMPAVAEPTVVELVVKSDEPPLGARVAAAVAVSAVVVGSCAVAGALLDSGSSKRALERENALLRAQLR